MRTSSPQTARRVGDTFPPWVPWALLITGTVAASLSAILIRYAEDADPLAKAFWRCAVGALVLLPFAWRGIRRASSAAWVSSTLAGVFLAIHFATWITSLDLTSVAASVLLVSTAPVFVALAAAVLFEERLGGKGWAGIAVAMAGTLLLAGTDFGGTSLDGNLLALIGGATAGGYVMAGGVSRRSLGILEYAVITYGVAALLLLGVIVVRGVPLTGYDGVTWWAIAGLIVGPQLLGHTVINLVLSDIDATTVSMTIMIEPVIAVALAFLLFSETPSWLVYPGGALILGGIYAVTRARRRIEVFPE